MLTVTYFPPIELSDGQYELGLTDLETFHTIPNIDSSNDKFNFVVNYNTENSTSDDAAHEYITKLDHFCAIIINKCRIVTSGAILKI